MHIHRRRRVAPRARHVDVDVDVHVHVHVNVAGVEPVAGRRAGNPTAIMYKLRVARATLMGITNATADDVSRGDEIGAAVTCARVILEAIAAAPYGVNDAAGFAPLLLGAGVELCSFVASQFDAWFASHDALCKLGGCDNVNAIVNSLFSVLQLVHGLADRAPLCNDAR